MSNWQYEQNKEIVERSQKREDAARRYLDACLEISDGSLGAGMQRIGTERYNEIIRELLRVLPTPKKP